MKGSIETYIAMNNPKATARVLEELGAPRITSNEDLLNKVHFATKQFGLKAFEKLAEIDTPYRKLILSQFGESKSNACGCSSADGSKEIVLKGRPVPTEELSDRKASADSNKPLLIAATVLLGVLTVAVIVKQ